MFKRLTAILIMIPLMMMTFPAHAAPFSFDDQYITLDVPAE